MAGSTGSRRRAQVVPLDAQNLARVHPVTASSVFWEVDPLSEAYCATDSEVDKSVWLAARAAEQGTVGFSIAEAGSEFGAFASVLYCPAAEAPGAVRMPTAPVGRDAWVVTSLHIDLAVRRRGWEAVLLDSVIMAAATAGAPALEAFGLRPDAPVSSPSAESLRRRSDRIGLVDAAILESAGFKVEADHPVIPRLRVSLPPAHDLLSAREVEDALARVPAV